MTGRTPRPVTLLAVAVLMVVAGCGGGSTTDTPTPTGPDPGSATTPSATTLATATTPTDSTTPTQQSPTRREESTTRRSNDPGRVDIPVRGVASLPFDVNRTYRRTMELLGDPAGVDPPEQIYLYRPDTPWKPTVQEPFAQTLLDARRESNFTFERHDGVVIGVTGDEEPDILQFTVVHEFVHGAQFESVEDTPGMQAAFAEDYHRRQVGASLVEGSASYVAFQYMRRYTDRNETWLRTATDEYLNASPAGKYAWAAYHFGQQYVADRVDSPSDHWRLYRNPPNTTEEVIHGLAPGSEPPTPLSVTVDGERWSVSGRQTRGEMFTRVVLAAELPEQRAARGAAGWGNDTLVTLERNGRQGYVWTVRWDSATDASEFLQAFRAAMDRRGDRRDGYWTGDDAAIRIVRVAPETVVVVTGPTGFVTGVDATGSNESVTVGTR